MIRVAIAASSPVVRAGLESLLRARADIAITGLANADVLIATEVEDDESTLPVVLLADDPTPEFAATSLRQGIRAVLPVNAGVEQIAAAASAAAAGLAVMRASEVEHMIRDQPSAGTSEPLTPRELEILQLLAAGLPNKQIAWRLGISEHTVKYHIASILTRLNAGSRAQAVAIGMRRGLILL